MRTFSLLLVSILASGCLTVAEVATKPMGQGDKFEERQAKYTANVRFGLVEEAEAMVEPELRAAFVAVADELREIRFTDHRVEPVDVSPVALTTSVVVLYKGYWLSSPFERRIRVVQNWRRASLTAPWYVTPDLETILAAPRS